MTPEAYCQEKSASSGSSFYYSFMFLPRAEREAIMAIYAFCREVDDTVDNCQDLSLARAKLGWWQSELDRAFQGSPTHPVGHAIAKTLKRYALKQQFLQEIIEGMTMDLDYQGYQTFDDLNLYCYRVASTVGLLAAEIFGYQNPATLNYAKTLGIAFQLVNIIRDVGEDASRSRIYLPENELEQFNVPAADILARRETPEFKTLMAFQAQRARSYYQQAQSELPIEDRYQQRVGLIMAKIYFTLLDEIEADGFKVLTSRTSLTPIRKLWLAYKTARQEKKFCKLSLNT